jgi:hypothetical protein
MTLRTVSLVLLAGLATAGCTALPRADLALARWLSPVDERPLASALAPMPDRWVPPRELRRIAATGTPLPSLEVRRTAWGVAVDEGDGCVWQARDWFAPASTWRNCGTSRSWHTARATVREEGRLWPLEVGNVARFERRAVTPEGKVSVRTRTCRVVDQVGVATAGQGVVATFKVRCEDGRRTRTTWWSADWGPVAFEERTSDRYEKEFWRRDL